MGFGFNENKLLPISGYLDPVTAIVAGGVGSAVIGGLGAKSASRSQNKASKRSIAEQRRQFDISRADRAPYRKVGSEALFSLADMMGVNTQNPYEPGTPEHTAFQNRQKYDFQQTPGYQFRLEQGTNALDASAAARGNLFSGRQLKALTEYGQNFGTNEYNNRFNRLASMAGMGQVSSGQSAGLGANYAQQMGGSIYDAGQARASGYMGQANAWQNALNQGLYAYGMSQQPQMTQWGTIPGSQQSNMLAAQW